MHKWRVERITWRTEKRRVVNRQQRETFGSLVLSYFPPITPIVYLCLLLTSILLNLFQDSPALCISGQMQLTSLTPNHSLLNSEVNSLPFISINHPTSPFFLSSFDCSIYPATYQYTCVCVCVRHCVPPWEPQHKRFNTFASHLHVSWATSSIWLWQWRGAGMTPSISLSLLFLPHFPSSSA